MEIEELKNIADKYLQKLSSNFSVNNEFIDSVNANEIENSGILDCINILNSEPGAKKIPACIIISEEETNCNLKENIFDVLGYYTKVGINKEGKIVLNKKCIEKCAKELSQKDLKLNSAIVPYPYTESIYKIVLLHELGHWMTHWMLDSNNKRWDDKFWDLTPNPNDLLEGLAQLFTYHAILGDNDFKNLKIIFETMLTGQCDPYHKHVPILAHENFSWKNTFEALAEIRISNSANPSLDEFLANFK